MCRHFDYDDNNDDAPRSRGVRGYEFVVRTIATVTTLQEAHEFNYIMQTVVNADFPDSYAFAEAALTCNKLLLRNVLAILQNCNQGQAPANA